MREIFMTVTANGRVADGVYKMVLTYGDGVPGFKPGQFVNIKIPDGDMILRRPFCIYTADKKELAIVYAVVGKGTDYMSSIQCGASLSVLLPLGNGFPELSGNIAAVGGGIGTAPLLESLKRNTAGKNKAYLGFASAENAEVFLKDFKQVSEVLLTTDDGSLGEKCFPTDLLLRDIKAGKKPDVIITCGPEIMMRTVKKIAQEYKIPAYMTGESRMGCGYGACLVCACKVNGEYKRACCDGPVFNLSEVEI